MILVLSILFVAAAAALAIHRLYDFATVEIKPREALVVKGGKGRSVHRFGRVFLIPMLQSHWLVSLDPFTLEGAVQELRNFEGVNYAARLKITLRVDDSPAALEKAADRFFGLPRERIEATVLDIAQRNFVIFLQEYGTGDLAGEERTLFSRVEESVRDDAQILGICIDAFDVIDFYDTEKRLQEKLEMTFGRDRKAHP
jgi:flotillin